MYQAFTKTEMTVMKCIFIFTNSKLAMIDDNFIAMFLHLMNITLSSFLSIGKLYVHWELDLFDHD